MGSDFDEKHGIGIIAHKDFNAHAAEIASTQTAWFFWGICARGTKFSVGPVCEASGADVTSGGLAVDQIRYAKTALHYSSDIPLLYYATHIARRAFPEDNNPETIVLSHISSSIPDIDEVVISGRSATLDNRSSSSPYTLIQRIRSSSAKDLFQTLRTNPTFFETYYKTAFSELDSDKAGYTGLWRLLANKLIVLESEQLNELAKTNPAKLNWQNDGSFDDPNITEQVATQFLKNILPLPLNPPSGVGELTDFTPIKNKIRAEWDKRAVEWIGD